jgi:glycolate oxidase FAD binding subunit
VAAVFASIDEAHAAAMRVGGSALSPLSLDLAASATARMLAPDLPGGWLLAVEVAGSEAGVERSRRELLGIARDVGCTAAFDLGAGEGEKLYTGLRDFGFAEEPDGSVHRSDAALLVRAAVLPSQVGQVCRLIGDEEPSGIVARAGNGIVYGCWPETTPEEMSGRVARLRVSTESLGGVLVVERYPPGPKRLGIDVWGIEGPDVELMRRIKREFDPVRILSPGRGPGDLPHAQPPPSWGKGL